LDAPPHNLEKHSCGPPPLLQRIEWSQLWISEVDDRLPTRPPPPCNPTQSNERRLLGPLDRTAVDWPGISHAYNLRGCAAMIASGYFGVCHTTETRLEPPSTHPVVWAQLGAEGMWHSGNAPPPSIKIYCPFLVHAWIKFTARPQKKLAQTEVHSPKEGSLKGNSARIEVHSGGVTGTAGRGPWGRQPLLDRLQRHKASLHPTLDSWSSGTTRGRKKKKCKAVEGCNGDASERLE